MRSCWKLFAIVKRKIREKNSGEINRNKKDMHARMYTQVDAMVYLDACLQQKKKLLLEIELA